MEATVDFNEVDEAGLLVAAQEFMTPPHLPSVGQRVWLKDPEGNQCWGTVVRVRPSTIHLRIDQASWLQGDFPEAAPPIASSSE